jgi:hypothetical protein
MAPYTDQDRRRFWDGFAARFPTLPLYWGNTYARWRNVPATELVVSHYVTGHSLGVFVRGVRGVPNRETAARLPEFSLALALDAPLGNPDFPFVTARPLDLGNASSWPECYDWLHATGERYVATLARVIGCAV